MAVSSPRRPRNSYPGPTASRTSPARCITSKTPVGTYRGPGRFEANFFRERLLDLMAGDLGLDPVEVRLKKLLAPAEIPYAIGKLVPYEAAGEYDTGDYASALRRALEGIDYWKIAALSGTRVDGRLHGVGIGCFVESSGAGPSETARIVVTPRGDVELYTGCASSGQGLETVMAQILADELGIPMDRIRVFHGTTSFVDEGYGTYHSRTVVVGGSAITVAAATLVGQLLALAARAHGHRSGRSRDARRRRLPARDRR
jgi:aerobic carbon-monoxide dehydrogenase large subunit